MQHHRSFGFGLFWRLVFLLALSRLVMSASLSHAKSDNHWKPATATWYGSAEGDGSDGKLSPPALHVVSVVRTRFVGKS